MSHVDVVIPCYNYAHYLERCVQSVLTQQGVDVRVLIIDDTSKDNSAEVGQRLAAADSRVEFRRHAENKGHIATYNEGLLGWASRDYSLLLSADDLLAPGALARAAGLMDRHPEVALTYGAALIITDTSEPKLPPDGTSDDYRLLSSAQFLKQCFAHGNPVPTPAAIVRTKVQQQIGGYRADLPHAGDMQMWMRFAVHGPVGVFRAVLAYYRMHATNMSHAYYARARGDTHEQAKVCSDILAQLGSKSTEANAWSLAMRRRLGEKAFWTASDLYDQGETAWREWADLSLEVYPELRESPSWRRMQMKTKLGPAWKVLRPVITALRGSPDTGMVSPHRPAPVQVNKRIGWWPEGTELA